MRQENFRIINRTQDIKILAELSIRGVGTNYPKNLLVYLNLSKRRWKLAESTHTIYTRNNMGEECEGNCGLWVLNEILKKTYPENLKKIVGAVWELPAK